MLWWCNGNCTMFKLQNKRQSRSHTSRNHILGAQNCKIMSGLWCSIVLKRKLRKIVPSKCNNSMHNVAKYQKLIWDESETRGFIHLFENSSIVQQTIFCIYVYTKKLYRRLSISRIISCLWLLLEKAGTTVTRSKKELRYHLSLYFKLKVMAWL